MGKICYRCISFTPRSDKQWDRELTNTNRWQKIFQLFCSHLQSAGSKMLLITYLFCQKLNFFLLPSSSNYSKEKAGISRKKMHSLLFFFFFSLLLPAQPFLLLRQGKARAVPAAGTWLPGRAVQPHCPTPASWFLEGNRGDPFPLLHTPFHALGKTPGLFKIST